MKWNPNKTESIRELGDIDISKIRGAYAITKMESILSSWSQLHSTPVGLSGLRQGTERAFAQLLIGFSDIFLPLPDLRSG